MLKLSRLIQPRNPLFWLLIAINGLSSAIAFMLRTYELPSAATLLLGGFALGNVIIGIAIALRLMADEPATVAAAGADHAGGVKERKARKSE